MSKRDQHTGDLFRDWRPPEVAPQIDPIVTRGGSMDVKISRAVGHALKQSGMSRKKVAEAMKEYLGDDSPVSAQMLDQYASPANTGHRITLERFLALIDVTGQHDLLGFICGQFDHVAVPKRYAEIIQLWHAEEEKAAIERRVLALKGKIGGRS